MCIFSPNVGFWREGRYIRALMIITGNGERIMSGQKIVDFVYVIIPRLTSPNPGILWKYSGWPTQGQGQSLKVSKKQLSLLRGQCLSWDKHKHKEKEKHNPWMFSTHNRLSGIKASPIVLLVILSYYGIHKGIPDSELHQKGCCKQRYFSDLLTSPHKPPAVRD